MQYINQLNKSNMSKKIQSVDGSPNLETENYSYEIEIRDQEGDTFSDSFDTLKEMRSYMKSLDHNEFEVIQTWRYLGDKYLGSVTSSRSVNY